MQVPRNAVKQKAQSSAEDIPGCKCTLKIPVVVYKTRDAGKARFSSVVSAELSVLLNFQSC